MRNLIFCFAVLSASVPLFAKGLVLQTGEQAVLKTKGSPSLTVSNSQTIKVISGEHEIHIVARQPGVAEVLISKPRQIIKVTVFNSKVGETRKTVSRWLSQVDGITMETLPDKIYLHGTALRQSDWLHLQKLKNQNAKTLASDVLPSERIWRQLQISVGNELKRRSISSARAVLKEGQIELLTSPSEKDKVTTSEVANQFGVKESLNGNNIELRPMIEIEILIAEMKKNSMRTLGIKPPDIYSATILPSGDLRSASVNFNSFVPELHAGFSHGTGRVLANPKLICRSGEVAHFVAGGEIPIKMMSWKTSDVIWKRYGVILDITPLADFNDGISTKITTEISLLDEAHKVDGIPGFLTNRIDTHFDLRGSKTIALSGLIKSEVGHGTSGAALLGDIPILGELFKSRDYQENKTELVIFVTPRVISPESPGPPPIGPAWWSNEDDDKD